MDHIMPGWMPVRALRRIGCRIATSEYANSLLGTIGAFWRQVSSVLLANIHRFVGAAVAWIGDQRAAPNARVGAFAVKPTADTIGVGERPSAMGLEGHLAEQPAERFTNDETARSTITTPVSLLSARRTAFGSRLITSISVRAAPEGRRVPSSHLRTVPTPVPMTAANSRCDRPSLCRARRASVSLGMTRCTIAPVSSPATNRATLPGRRTGRPPGGFRFHFLRHCATNSFKLRASSLLSRALRSAFSFFA